MSVAVSTGSQPRRVPDGQYTNVVYSFIRDGKYADAISILSQELQNYSKSRAALSLLGYCYYQSQDFHNAVSWCAFSPMAA